MAENAPKIEDMLRNSVAESSSKESQPKTESSDDALHYESHYLLDKQPCRECGSTNVYTRIYFHKISGHSRWLCYNCADNYVDYRGYELLTVPVLSNTKQEP